MKKTVFKKSNQLIWGSILILILSVSVFIGCSKKDEVKQKLNSTSQSSKLVVQNSRIFTDQQINEISEFHNLYLDTFFNQVNLSTITLPELNVVISNYFSPFENSHNLNLSNPTEQDIIEGVNMYINNKTDFNVLISNVENLMLNLDLNNSNCFINLVSDLNLLKSNATNTFIGTDLDCAISMIEVLKKSSYYWLPLASGGSGVGSDKFQEYLNNNFPEDYIPSMSMSEVIGRTALADGTSMMWFCMVVAVSGSINPALIPPAILGYFGARVGGASITAFFQNLILLD